MAVLRGGSGVLLAAVALAGAWVVSGPGDRASAAHMPLSRSTVQDAPPWQGGEVCYEIFVRSFFDSNGDGVGDLRGLTLRLDHVNDGDPATATDLGARCVWLMPVARSGSYHGYDVIDYYRVDSRYGSEADFRAFVSEAHRRGIRVLVDMVVNHTSEQHPFFRDALLDPASPYRSWYRFRPEPGPPDEWGGDNWHRSEFREEYYYGLFWRGMPDLNWEEEAVREEMKRVAAYWLRDMGVDGLRLDAVWHLMEDPETGRAGHLPGTHRVLREYAAHVRTVKPGAFTVGEVFDGTEALMAYYPDQLDAYFAFSVSDGILEAVRSGTGGALTRAVVELQERVPNHRWAPFLRNHDQPRVLTVLGGDVRRARLAATLLLTLPGVPFVYYGEEVGMTGDKPDPRIRTPLHWTAGPGAGFTSGVPWEPLHPDSLSANVAVQDPDPGSLLNHYRHLIHLRGREPALWSSGRFEPVETGDPGVLAYLRTRGDARVLVVANLTEVPWPGATLAVAPGVLAPGRWWATDLLEGAGAGPVGVGGGGEVELSGDLLGLSPLSARVIRLGPAR